MEPIWAVGLMTGTVLDGNIDVALIKTDGERIEEFGPYVLAPYPEWIRSLLEETLAEARAWNFNGPEPEIFETSRGGFDARPVGRGQGACRRLRPDHGRYRRGRLPWPRLCCIERRRRIAWATHASSAMAS